MLHRNLALLLVFLFSVAGHATLLEALTHRQEPLWHAGIFLLMAPMLGLLIGGFLVEDGRRAGLYVSAASAALHLLLDLACAALLWLRPLEWRFGVASAAVGALGAGWLLRQSLRGLHPPPPDESGGPVPRWRHELDLLGGNAIGLTLLSLGFVAAGLYGVLARLARGWDVDARLLGAVLFFAACAAVGAWMGLERRAALLGLPAPRPLGRLWPARWRRTVYLASREGLVQRDRRGLTLIGWDDIADVSLAEVSGNQALLLWLARPEAGLRRWRAPADEARGPRWRRSWERSCRLCRALYGADLLIMGVVCDEGPGALLTKLRRGLDDDAGRRGLPPTPDP